MSNALNPVARDAYGFALHYYSTANSKDYKPVNGNKQPFANAAAAGFGFVSLYNGNIAATSLNIPQLGDALLYTYKYDQLNRLLKQFTYKGLNAQTNNWNPVGIDDYREEISYDANGNIKTYKRNGTVAGNNPLAMDNMTYNYYPNTNKLSHVNDVVAANNYTEDIDNQNANNYRYDATGNLTGDKAENIKNIYWTVYGKIKSIEKQNGDFINYAYDAAGNRVTKVVSPVNGPASTTCYVRDAGGNVMSTYAVNAALNNGHLTQTEVHLYGSSRLGIYNRNVDVQNFVLNTTGIYTFERGNKFFELSNHLGNVLVTVSDRKIGVDINGDGVVDYYYADVISAQDYYPFGMTQPGRKYQSGASTYRYGFNGQEKSVENNPNGDSYTAEFWEYDSRIGRRWNIDPIPKSMVSPYVCLGDNPIMYIDPLGNDWYRDKKGSDKGQVRWIEGSGKQKNMTHIGATYDGYTQEAGGRRWMNGNDKGEKFTWLEPAVVSSKKKSDNSIIGRSSWGSNLNWSVNRGRELQPLQDIYDYRKVKGQALKQDGDSYDYTNSFSELVTKYKVRNSFKEGGAMATGFFLAPFAAMAAAETGAVSYLLFSGPPASARLIVAGADATYQLVKTHTWNPLQTLSSQFGPLTYALGTNNTSFNWQTGKITITPTSFRQTVISTGFNMLGGKIIGELGGPGNGWREILSGGILTTLPSIWGDGVNDVIGKK